MSEASTTSASERWAGTRALRLIWMLVGLGAAVHLLYYGLRTVDDMFIFLRYAENFARGEGLVFNPGERVEGFSSPLWVLLLTPGALLGINLVTWSKLLSLSCFLALMTGVYRVAPSSTARLAASMMHWGVPKSGSPALRSITS